MATNVDSEKNPKNYSCQHHARNLLKALNESRKLPSLCDIIVLIDKTEIPAQKSVLSAASQYFRAYFSYEVKTESLKTERVRVDLTPLEISIATFQDILDYIYTAEITLSTDNIQDLFQASDLLLMSDLKNLCCEYLEHCISPVNCVGIREFTARFASPWVHFKATQYLDKNFREVSNGEEFLGLDVDSVREILIRDELNVRGESELPIVQCILQWYRYNRQERENDLTDLLINCVRASRLTEDCFTTLRYEDCGQLNITEFLRNLQSHPRLDEPRGTTAVIVVCGGEGYVSRNEDTEVEVKPCLRCVKLYKNNSVKVGKWIELTPMLTPRSSHGLVEVGGLIYAIGGRDNTCRLLNSGEKYNPKTNEWTVIAPMNHARVGFGLVAIDHNIYAIGGSNDMTDPMTSMEVYNTFSNEWQSLPDITMKKVWSTYAAVDKKIYVIAGGIIGKFYEAVECFDSRTQTWTSVSPMRERRCDARAVAVDDDIYVFGGFRRIECPSAMHSGHSLKFCGAEVYSTTNDYWVPISKRGLEPGMCIMHDKSHVEGTVYDGNEILAIGDLDIGTGSDCIRGFDRYVNEWRTVVQNQPPNQRCYQCCLLNIPNSTFAKVLKQQASTPT
ncbi:hypothetical protein LOTGIDRAFT_229825 [Lottia gigantea]|uniref:BTB domain-containing protein n=1 Tax=Lottia gigantea TaxID=225164 RepID=V3ZFA9_LOTGI|nr:hypothetical protein LOTGIDRAFT_229825 [Lottia gigantea]ESO82812.1 hypothetical protein LOTGIDRAFT_229825 [Lottia gigantea]